MLTQFRTYNLAVELHEKCKAVTLPGYIKTQLVRASSSIALNLAEGSAKPTEADRQKFYNTAFGSCREVQAIIHIERATMSHLAKQADVLAAHLYRLTRR
ncbi:MAG TPA: four helix bundle protein [Bdellovibrionales bacterium]|nr:four helix bundle protein [Bdellovibrionales bacterium]